jgi:hypothetical protein
MESNRIFVEACQRAETTIKTIWRDIAANYTIGWMGPIEVVIRRYPHITAKITDIRARVSNGLPVVIYQTRESPPKGMVAAIPYVKLENNPYNCRLIASNNLTPQEVRVLNDFAQAFWFLIGNEILPGPENSEELERKLAEWTDITLLKLK